MQIKELVLQNAKSFRDEVSIHFRKDLNVLIGPNAGGKSNLMDVMNVSLAHYFVHPWLLQPSTPSPGVTEYRLRRINPFNPVQRFLDKNSKTQDRPQTVRICFEVTSEDLANLETMRSNKNKLAEFENREYRSNSLGNLVFLQDDFLQYKKEDVEYQITEYSQPSSGDQGSWSKGFLQYLNYFELISILTEEYNKTCPDQEKIGRLFPLTLYFSPYRNPATQNLRVSIADLDEAGLVTQYRKTTSRDTTSVLQYASYHFGLKFRNYDDNAQRFGNDEEVQSILKHLRTLGYTGFDMIAIDKRKNVYEVIIKKRGRAIKITEASSGEKEIMSLLLGLFANNVKGGVVIIDEPDLHLHPKWQRSLLDLLASLSEERRIQFVLATHSPQFITTESIQNTFRVYEENGTSKVFIPSSEDMQKSDIKDIFHIVNVLNNEKIFFAEKVILVEGVVDRIIYEKVLSVLKKTQNNSETIEIVEVHGKDNFERFRDFLSTWKIRSYILADLDFLAERCS